MTTLAINYKHGKGNVELNLDALMPCNDQDFRRVLSFLDLSDGRREMHVEALRDYILQEIAVLDVILEQEQKKKVLDRKKRYQTNLKMLIKRYSWLETPQKSFEKQEEKSMNTTCTFTSDSIIRDGKATPVGYSVTPSGAVVAIILDGTRERIRIEETEPCYQEALAAAKASNNAVKNKPAVKLAERPAIIPDPEEKPEPEKKNPKQARGPVPEKTFIGQTIQGNGWHILFDGTTSRTRVIFDAEPSGKVKKIIAEAGFYYSSVMDSWNKKLTFKAYRAAGELAKKLNKLYQNAA